MSQKKSLFQGETSPFSSSSSSSSSSSGSPNGSATTTEEDDRQDDEVFLPQEDAVLGDLFDMALFNVDAKETDVAHVLRPLSTVEERKESINRLRQWRSNMPTSLAKLISLYVVKEYDIMDPKRTLRLVFLSNMLRGPPVMILRSQNKGFGLYAADRIEPRKPVAQYIGMIHKGAEHIEGCYVVEVCKRTGLSSEIWLIDGQYGFPLSAKGRWVNEEIVNGKRVMNVRLKWDNAASVANFYTCGSNGLEKGEELLWDYGPEYNRDKYE